MEHFRKAVFIIGAPGSGKTTATLRLMEAIRATHRHVEYGSSTKLIPFTEFNNGDLARTWRFLGVFNPVHGYAQGTDRMSMGAQPFFTEFLALNLANAVIEGDRLCTAKSMVECWVYRYDVHVIELQADPMVRDMRYLERGSKQAESFIRGRLTKIMNLKLRMVGDRPNLHWKAFRNNTPADADVVHEHLTRLL